MVVQLIEFFLLLLLFVPSPVAMDSGMVFCEFFFPCNQALSVCTTFVIVLLKTSSVLFCDIAAYGHWNAVFNSSSMLHPKSLASSLFGDFYR